jgi:ubiquinol-cytochrome c reductase cytochrome b subunit
VRRIKAILEWIEFRLQIGAAAREALAHPIPASSASWWYVFGSAALTVFVVQLITGVLLALVYVPSAAEAWNSLQVLNHDLTLGWFLRALHGWGSNFMVAIVLIHMVQVFLFGAYKYPRELTWIVGVLLLLMTLAMAFTGQVLRFDQDAYWGLGIGASISGRLPVIGGALVHLLLGGPIIAGDTLSRFFALHVFVIPALLLGLVGLHLLMVLKLGVSEWPMPGRLVRRETYLKQYAELTREGVPFAPDAIWKDLIFAACIIAALVFCAAVFGPFGPTGEPDPTIIQTIPKPDFFFLWLYAMLSLLPPELETPVLLIAPPIGILLLLVLPLVAGEGERSWRRRPVAVLTVLLLAVTLSSLTRMARVAPWSPEMYAWSGAPVPAADLKGRSPLERRGALVFQGKQCRSCHALGGLGGMRGPALDSVAARLTQGELIRQVLQGGGNMPAYGKNLNPAETTALVAFLETLHPQGRAAAEDAAASQ